MLHKDRFPDRLNRQVDDTKDIVIEKDMLAVKLKNTATKIAKLESKVKRKRTMRF